MKVALMFSKYQEKFPIEQVGYGRHSIEVAATVRVGEQIIEFLQRHYPNCEVERETHDPIIWLSIPSYTQPYTCLIPTAPDEQFVRFLPGVNLQAA